MLFIIDESVINFFASGQPQEGDMEAIEYLTMGVAEGKHRLGGRRTHLQELAALNDLTSRARAVLRQAASRYAQEGNLYQRLDIYSIVTKNQHQVSCAVQNNQRLIYLPLRWFDTSDKIQRTILLGENQSDARVLEIVAKAALASDKLTAIPLSCERQGGGGSSIGHTLTAIVDAGQRFCLCVVDSDRDHPGDALGNTAQSVQQYCDHSAYPLVNVLTISGRDLENILPDKFYQTQYGRSSLYYKMTEVLLYLSSLSDAGGRLYLDIEYGLTLCDVLKLDAGGTARGFWNARVTTLHNFLGLPPNHFPCSATSTCAYIPGSHSKCILVQGNPQDILRIFADKHAADSGHTIAAMIPPWQWAEWRRLGMAIASWCCGDSKPRV